MVASASSESKGSSIYLAVVARQGLIIWVIGAPSLPVGYSGCSPLSPESHLCLIQGDGDQCLNLCLMGLTWIQGLRTLDI